MIFVNTKFFMGSIFLKKSKIFHQNVQFVDTTIQNFVYLQFLQVAWRDSSTPNYPVIDSWRLVFTPKIILWYIMFAFLWSKWQWWRYCLLWLRFKLYAAAQDIHFVSGSNVNWYDLIFKEVLIWVFERKGC